MKKYFIIVVVLIFALLCAGLYALKSAQPAYDLNVLLAGNIIMAILTVLTYYMVISQADKNPAAFIRGVSASTFLKLLVCMGSILIYVMIKQGKNIYKPSLFVLLGIYAVYTITESMVLSKLVRKAK